MLRASSSDARSPSRTTKRRAVGADGGAAEGGLAASSRSSRIATLNGAIFLGRADRIGSLAVGKSADLVVVKGDPAARIADVEHVEIVWQ